jgi:hypothetical protein
MRAVSECWPRHPPSVIRLKHSIAPAGKAVERVAAIASAGADRFLILARSPAGSRPDIRDSGRAAVHRKLMSDL